MQCIPATKETRFPGTTNSSTAGAASKSFHLRNNHDTLYSRLNTEYWINTTYSGIQLYSSCSVIKIGNLTLAKKRPNLDFLETWQTILSKDQKCTLDIWWNWKVTTLEKDFLRSGKCRVVMIPCHCRCRHFACFMFSGQAFIQYWRRRTCRKCREIPRRSISSRRYCKREFWTFDDSMETQ